MRKNDLYGWQSKKDNKVRYGFYWGLDYKGRFLVKHLLDVGYGNPRCRLGENHWFVLPLEVYSNVRV